jgi:hypothetical protein
MAHHRREWVEVEVRRRQICSLLLTVDPRRISARRTRDLCQCSTMVPQGQGNIRQTCLRSRDTFRLLSRTICPPTCKASPHLIFLTTLRMVTEGWGTCPGGLPHSLAEEGLLVRDRPHLGLALDRMVILTVFLRPTWDRCRGRCSLSTLSIHSSRFVVCSSLF